MVEIHSQKVITGIVMNVGNKADTLNVYGWDESTGAWVLIEGVSTATSYSNKTVTMPAGTSYTKLKLDVEGANQVRIKDMTINIDVNS